MARSPLADYPLKVDGTDLTNYPYGKAQNITVPADGTGTPWIDTVINDLFGFQQRILQLAGLAPDGNNETAQASQYLESIRRCAGYPGTIIMVGFAVPPTGLRLIGLSGGTTFLSGKEDLEAAVYVGDGNNSSVHAAGGKFCKTSDAAGTTASTSGSWLTLPDYRGRVPRGLDTSGTIDPGGASRNLGDEQLHATQVHNHVIENNSTGDTYNDGPNVEIATGGGYAPIRRINPTFATVIASDTEIGEDITVSGITGVGKVDDVETRMKNVSTFFAMWY